MRENILVDLDHVLSNAFWRDPMIKQVGTELTWDDYHAANKDDGPIWDLVNLISHLTNVYNIIGLTARPEKWRKQSVEWCVKHGVHLDELLMRPDNEYRPANELKIELANKRFPSGVRDHVAFILDDRADVCTAFAEIGVTALQVTARHE